MSSLCAGIDVVEIDRVERALKHHPERFLQRLYTPLDLAENAIDLPTGFIAATSDPGC